MTEASLSTVEGAEAETRSGGSAGAQTPVMGPGRSRVWVPSPDPSLQQHLPKPHFGHILQVSRGSGVLLSSNECHQRPV